MAVIILIIATVLVFALQVLSGGLVSNYFALTPALVLQQPWAIVSAIFLHGSPIHLFFNMFGLLMFGPLLEQKIGSRNFLMLYFASGIIGNLGYIFTAFGSATPVLGASGAIYGVLGALAILQPNLMVFVGFFPMPMYMAAVFWVFAEFSAGVGGTQPGIANFAHLFGLFGGLLFGRHFKSEILKRGGWLHDG